MTSFADTFEAAARRHRGVLLAAPVLGLLVGFFVGPSLGGPDIVAAAGIYLGSIVTLVLCAKVVGDSFGGGAAGNPPAMRSLYMQHLALAVALSWLARALMALTLAPFQVGAGAPSWVLFDPILMGWPLDALLVTVTLSLTTILRRGGTALAFVFVFLVGAVAMDASIAPEQFGATGPLLQVIGFPWLELRAVPEAFTTGDWAAFGLGTAKVLGYWLAWAALGLGVLTYRTRKAPVATA